MLSLSGSRSSGETVDELFFDRRCCFSFEIMHVFLCFKPSFQGQWYYFVQTVFKEKSTDVAKPFSEIRGESVRLVEDIKAYPGGREVTDSGGPVCPN